MTTRSFALRVARHAAGVLRVINPVQADAMIAELAHIDDDRAALAFAGGCVIAAYRQRASVVAVGVVVGRSLVALAAGLFGMMHILLSGQNLVLKLLLMAGLPGTIITPGAYHIRVTAELSLVHWIWTTTVIGGIGVLHLAAAAAVWKGKDRDLSIIALATVGLALLLPLLGTGALTLPAIYSGLIAIVVAAGLVFTHVWRRETARLQRLST